MSSFAKYQPVKKADSKMFQFQSSLPALPVPSLEETATRFYNSIKPLGSPEEVAKTKERIDSFLASDRVKQLQAELVARKDAMEKKGRSWLIDWWNDYAYMAYRDSVVINVSYFFQFIDDPYRRCQLERSAALISSAVKFRAQLLKQGLEPDMAGKNPLCMEQYQYMLHACRLPLKVDEVAVYDPEKHFTLAVVRKGKFYSIPLAKKNGQVLNAAEIKVLLERVKQLADKDGWDSAPLGLLTSENRDTWLQARDLLLNNSPGNKKSLEKIESSMLLLCLDDTMPVSREETGRACWHGDGRNRFFDKSLQLIVFENGKAGFLGEHSMMDATPTSRVCEYICADTIPNAPSPESVDHNNLPEVESLLFQYPNTFESFIANAKNRLQADIDRHDHRVLAYFGYGKETIKKFKTSPDAFVQLSIQLAYYKMFGECRATYESAQTKKYKWGRTETCRSVSNESVAFVKKAVDPSVSATEKAKLARLAMKVQTEYMGNCVNGLGVDRHFLGLKMLMKPTDKIELFNDPLFKRSCHWNLSTSQISSEFFDGYGWGEVVPDGFGIAYMIRKGSIHYNVACLKGGVGFDHGPGSWKGKGKGVEDAAQKMCMYLEQSLQELQQIFESETGASGKSKL